MFLINKKSLAENIGAKEYAFADDFEMNQEKIAMWRVAAHCRKRLTYS